MARAPFIDGAAMALEPAHALALASALMLALANAVVKRQGDPLLARASLSSLAAAMSLPFALALGPLNAAGWVWLGAGLLAHWGYQFFLIRAFRAGDLSLVFPIMRGAAPALAALGAYVGLGERLSGLAILGLLVASAAAAAIGWPAAPRGGVKALSPAVAAALATAAFIALYTVLDAQGARASDNAYAYVAWLFTLDPIGVVFGLWRTRGRAGLIAAARGWRDGLAAAALSIGGYGAAIIAMADAPVAEIAALRETSVLIAAALGAIWLKEPFGARRIAGAAAMAVGLALMQLG